MEETTITMGRPPKPIDWDLVDKLLIRQNKGAEIASHFFIDDSTFYRRVKEKYGVTFTTYAASFYSKGHSSLRTKQWDKAMEGNVTMLLKLGEYYLPDQKPVGNESENSPNQSIIDSSHENMKLKAELQALKEKMEKLTQNANES